MAERTPVRLKIVEMKSKCNSGHKVGQEFIMDRYTPEGICLTAFAGLLPLARILASGGELGSEPGKIISGCPDPAGGVIFEITRVEE